MGVCVRVCAYVCLTVRERPRGREKEGGGHSGREGWRRRRKRIKDEGQRGGC